MHSVAQQMEGLATLAGSRPGAGVVAYFAGEYPNCDTRSLEAALWAFYHADSFREGCLLAVNLGDDADTTGAVYGQLAGAFYGERGIPESWRLRLAQRPLIESLAGRLYELSRAF